MSVDGTEAAQPGPDKPVLDETWTPVEQLPAADDSDYSEEEVKLRKHIDTLDNTDNFISARTVDYLCYARFWSRPST